MIILKEKAENSLVFRTSVERSAIYKADFSSCLHFDEKLPEELHSLTIAFLNDLRINSLTKL